MEEKYGTEKYGIEKYGDDRRRLYLKFEDIKQKKTREACFGSRFILVEGDFQR